MTFEALNTFLEQNIPCDRIPGCDILVYRHGELIYRKQYGFRNYLKTEPVRTDDYYYLYSCSKVLTCTSVMHLVEQGLISLDDPLEKYLPAFGQVRMVDGSKPRQPILIRHCFAMTSGMNYDLRAPAIYEVLQKNPDANTQEIAEAIAKTPLRSEPGTHYFYSLSHDILAAVAEVVTGKSFDAYIREWALEPLGLSHTFFHQNEETRRQMAAQYTWDKDHLKSFGLENHFILSSNYHSGGAGLIAQAEDYGKFLAALSVGGKGLLRPETIERMKENQQNEVSLKEYWSSARKNPYTYALGVRAMVHPELTGRKIPVGEFGWDGAAGAYTLVDTVNEIAIFYAQHVCGCSIAYDKIHPGIRNRVYEALGL